MFPRAADKIILLFLVCAGCPIRFAHAHDIPTTDGRVFKNASVLRLEDDGVVIQRFEAKLFRRQYEVILESPEKFLRVVSRFDYPDDYESVYTIQNGQKLVGRPAENKAVTLMTVGDAVVFQGRCKGLRDAEII